MLTVDVGMNVLLGDVIAVGQVVAEPGGVQNGAGADDLAFRNAGDSGKHVGHDVHGVADDDIQGVGCDRRDLWRNVFHDVDVGLRQIDAALTGFAPDAGGDDDDVGVCCVSVITGNDGDRLAEAGSLNDVHDLALYLLLVDIDHYDLGSNVPQRQCVGDGRSHIAGSNNSYFSAHEKTPLGWGSAAQCGTA